MLSGRSTKFTFCFTSVLYFRLSYVPPYTTSAVLPSFSSILSAIEEIVQSFCLHPTEATESNASSCSIIFKISFDATYVFSAGAFTMIMSLSRPTGIFTFSGTSKYFTTFPLYSLAVSSFSFASL